MIKRDTIDKIIEDGKSLFLSLAVTFPFALFVAGLAYWDDIISKFITNGTVKLGINANQIETVAFSYIDRNILDTILTMFFWTSVGILSLFMLWLITSTYATISNIILIDSIYKNKPSHYLMKASESIVKRILVSVSSVFSIIVIIKAVLPNVMRNFGINILSEDFDAYRLFVSVFWLIIFAQILIFIKIIAVRSIQYLKSPIE